VSILPWTPRPQFTSSKIRRSIARHLCPKSIHVLSVRQLRLAFHLEISPGLFTVFDEQSIICPLDDNFFE
jgi:hypothetical protein